MKENFVKAGVMMVPFDDWKRRVDPGEETYSVGARSPLEDEVRIARDREALVTCQILTEWIGAWSWRRFQLLFRSSAPGVRRADF